MKTKVASYDLKDLSLLLKEYNTPIIAPSFAAHYDVPEAIHVMAVTTAISLQMIYKWKVALPET